MFKIKLPRKQNINKNNVRFNVILYIITILFVSSCLKDDSINDGFIKYLDENKNMISLHLVNEEATRTLFRALNVYEENIFDENGELTYNITSNNMLLGQYVFSNNFEKRFLGYVILEKESIQIGEFIDEVRGKKGERDITVSFYLNPEGSELFHEFTSNNMGKYIAVVFDNKVMLYARILMPLKNIINILIDF